MAGAAEGRASPRLKASDRRPPPKDPESHHLRFQDTSTGLHTRLGRSSWPNGHNLSYRKCHPATCAQPSAGRRPLVPRGRVAPGRRHTWTWSIAKPPDVAVCVRGRLCFGWSGRLAWLGRRSCPAAPASSPDIRKRPKEPRARIVRPIRESVESFGSPWPLRAGITLRRGACSANGLIHHLARSRAPRWASSTGCAPSPVAADPPVDRK
jgi:hypothetical protein